MNQKLYHQVEKELWECMTETERQEYRTFLSEHPELEKELMNCDRRYYRQHLNESDLPEGCKIEDTDGSTSPIPTTRKGGMCTGPDYVDMIEQTECDKNGEEYYRDPLIREAVKSLTERQRQAMEYTVLYEIPTTKLAKAWGCSERNVRKLRERALHNVCEHYAKALKKKPSHTLAEQEFLKQYDIQEAVMTPLIKDKNRKAKLCQTKQYTAEYGSLGACMPIIIQEGMTA
jgi:hypothetical protein